MILVKAEDGRIVFNVQQIERSAGAYDPIVSTHCESDTGIRSKTHAEHVADTRGYDLQRQGQVWDRLTDDD
ncbi:hypothetical protein [Streptomyces sp. NRRL B-24484]|uniref:hypothetical protein n=1 Tax=Streptomyces sp. NRRL B-24484 TaxID=1463833 RepID=UPI0004C288EB|nr:hypothetical protein [Streptomyces sp. NRRL B-24484]